MTYARPLTILAILGISTASLYAYTYKTPEERIIESIRIQNQAIEEANSAKIDSYRAILDKCYKTATGSSREILEKLDACKNIQKPELQMIISYSGSIERVSEGNEAIKYSQWEADCISKFKNEDEQFTCWMSGADYIKYKPAYKLKWDPVENNFRKFKNNVVKTTASGSVIPEAPSQIKCSIGTGSHDVRPLAYKYPWVAWWKNNNPSWITLWSKALEKEFDNANILWFVWSARPANEKSFYYGFPDLENGMKAKILIIKRSYKNSTVKSYLKIWGTDSIESDIDRNRTIWDLSDTELLSIIRSQIKKESGSLSDYIFNNIIICKSL